MEVALPAFVHVGGERHAAQILDLSPGGARLKVDVSLPVGTAVTLASGTLGRAAVVRWQTDNLIGLCFDIELDDREVTALMTRSKALSAWRKVRD